MAAFPGNNMQCLSDQQRNLARNEDGGPVYSEIFSQFLSFMMFVGKGR